MIIFIDLNMISTNNLKKNDIKYFWPLFSRFVPLCKGESKSCVLLHNLPLKNRNKV